eukprot:873192-Amphidinium_carterae.2
MIGQRPENKTHEGQDVGGIFKCLTQMHEPFSLCTSYGLSAYDIPAFSKNKKIIIYLLFLLNFLAIVANVYKPKKIETSSAAGRIEWI